MVSKRGVEKDTSSSMQPENAAGPASSSPFDDIQNSSSCTSNHRRGNSKRPKNVTTKEYQNHVERGMVENLQGSPLQGVVACLTGLPPHEKDHFHAMIQSLGGR
jgi:hypothetical protein